MGCTRAIVCIVYGVTAAVSREYFAGCNFIRIVYSYIAMYVCMRCLCIHSWRVEVYSKYFILKKTRPFLPIEWSEAIYLYDHY